MAFTDQFYQDPQGGFHFLSAQDHENAEAQGLPLPAANWVLATVQQVASQNLPSPAQLLLAYQASAKVELDSTSVTLERITEGVSLGTCAFTNPGIIAFMNYRKALRACVQATSVGTLPSRPPYPSGT